MSKAWKQAFADEMGDFDEKRYRNDAEYRYMFDSAFRFYLAGRKAQAAADLKIANNYADVVDGTDGPRPNLALTIASEIRAQIQG